MKIIITGSLGHIGKPLTETLVQKGHAVAVISSKPDKKATIEALGATAAIGTIEDADFLAATFTGADAVYTMLPPPDFTNPNLDLVATCSQIANNYLQAIKASGVKKVVHLSSIGAHLAKGSGLILLHHAVEGILDKLPDLAITFVRPAGFYYNLFSFIPGIKHTGMIMSNYGADDKLIWVSPSDIAIAVAEELETPGINRKVRYVASEELTGNEVAGILGAAIGKPDLKWIVISNEQTRTALEGFGMPKQIAAGFVEMNASMHNGKLYENYYKNRPKALGRVKLTEFAKEFAAAFKQN